MVGKMNIVHKTNQVIDKNNYLFNTKDTNTNLTITVCQNCSLCDIEFLQNFSINTVCNLTHNHYDFQQSC